jgi:hypothetical protein
MTSVDSINREGESAYDDEKENSPIGFFWPLSTLQ